MAVTVASSPEAVTPTGHDGSSNDPTSPPPEASSSTNTDYTESDWLHYFESPIVDEDNLHLAAEEYARENLAGAVSSRERPTWKVDETGGKDVVVTFDEARKRVWKCAKAEIESYRSGITEKTGKGFEEVDPFKDVMDAYLGKSSTLMQLMESALGLSYQKARFWWFSICSEPVYCKSVVAGTKRLA